MAAKAIQRTEQLDTLATDLYKHIQYAPRLINEKVHSDDYKDTTVFTYFLGMRNYVKTGVPNLKMAPKAFYEAVQHCIDTHVAQLTPKVNERTRQVHRKAPVKVYHIDPNKNRQDKKINISSVATKLSGKVNAYGIKVGNNIKLFENQDIMDGYIQCLNDFKPQLNEDITWDVLDLTYTIKQ